MELPAARALGSWWRRLVALTRRRMQPLLTPGPIAAPPTVPARPLLRWPPGWRLDDARQMLVGPRGEEVTVETFYAAGR